MDDITLAHMVDEIAAVLCKYLPNGNACTLRAEAAHLKSKSYAQVFAFLADRGGIFSVNAELQHPPPVPSNLNLKCIASK